MKKSALLTKLNKKIPVLTLDVLSIPFAWYLAYWLRYNLKPFPNELISSNSLQTIVLLMTVQVTSYYYFKVYRGLWRFSSIGDMFRIIKSVVSATVLIIPTLYLSSLLHFVPRSVFPLYCLILTTLLCGARLTRRAIFDRFSQHLPNTLQQRVLVLGAGKAGEMLIRELKKHPAYHLIGLMDDNLSKRGLEIHSVRVLGASRDLPELVERHKADLVLIAIPSARSASMRRIVGLCEQAKVAFRTLPSLVALADGTVTVNDLREVNIEDLLGRDQIQLEWDKIIAHIANRRVLVTGGGGSIGSELCRQISALAPESLMIIDNSEFNLYQIEQELRQKFPQLLIQIVLLSVTDATGIDYHFQQFKPQIVFHVAAFKHVPMLEEQIRVAVKNNVLGTKIVAEASIAAKVEKFVLISTDKAVNPTNVMGTTKRVAEIYCQNLDERVATQFITVRFGNVLDSAGSVVPLFRRQLQAGGPLTVTHPDIQRYFMTIPEACQLILQAMVNGHGGEIFVLDMGEPIKIAYLAEQMIRLAGKQPGQDIQIEYTGLRPGEKLFEELFHESEQLNNTEHAKLFKARVRHLDWQELTRTLRLLDNACEINNVDELQVLLKSLVPEFKSSMAVDAITL